MEPVFGQACGQQVAVEAVVPVFGRVLLHEQLVLGFGFASALEHAR